MGTPKAQTLQQRFGFQDKDLSRPKHDEIMLWLDENILKILDSFTWIRSLYRDRGAIELWDSKSIEKKFHLKDKPPFPEFKISSVKKIWEKPVLQKEFCIGFIDFVAIFNIPVLKVEYKSEGREGKFLWSPDNLEIRINFEVKTAIPSLGELFRQIQMYRSYLSSSLNNKFVVVSPDNRFEKQILDQGIGFLKYDPNKVDEV